MFCWLLAEEFTGVVEKSFDFKKDMYEELVVAAVAKLPDANNEEDATVVGALDVDFTDGGVSWLRTNKTQFQWVL